ncbi:MAG: hypothetical protein V4813_16555 [Gemmatimonadota bacterium]
MVDRRTFLSVAGFAGVGALLDGRRSRVVPARADTLAPCGADHARAHGPVKHPTPRPGITAAKVLAASQLSAWPHLQQLFDGIRAMPAIADGIRCSCGCAELPEYYSLLSCFEEPAMATICPICQGAGKLAVRLHGEGQTLAQIRTAVDAQFG